MADKTFHSITLPGTDPARIPDMAAEFNTATSYAVRDYCTYQGILYRCTTAHTGAWNASHFQATNLDNEFDDKLKIPPFQASAPANPRVGDLWIDNDEDSPILSIDPAPIAGSTNAVQSGGTRTLIDGVSVQKANRNLLTGDYSTSATYEVGQLVLYYPDNFSITHQYVVGESCIRSGKVYKCTTAHKGSWNASHFQEQYTTSTDTLYRCITRIGTPEAWTPAHWQATNINTEINRLRESEADTDMIAENYGDSSSYAVGDYVVHNSDLFRCISAVSDTGSWDPDYWIQIALADDVSETNQILNRIFEDTYTLKNISFTSGYISNNVSIGSTVDLTPHYSNIYNYCLSEVKKGQICYLTCQGGSTARAYSFIDENYKMFYVAPINSSYDNYKLIAPCDGFLACNNQTSFANPQLKIAIIDLDDLITRMDELEETTEEQFENLTKTIQQAVDTLPKNIKSGSLIQVDGAQVISKMIIDTEDTSADIIICGNNFAPKFQSGSSGTLSWAVDNDGVISFTGTPASDVTLCIYNVFINTKVSVSCFNNLSNNRLTIFGVTSGNNSQLNMSSVNATTIWEPLNPITELRIRIPSGFNATGLILKPYITIDETIENWEPYNGRTINVSLDSEGIVQEEITLVETDKFIYSDSGNLTVYLVENINDIIDTRFNELKITPEQATFFDKTYYNLIDPEAIDTGLYFFPSTGKISSAALATGSAFTGLIEVEEGEAYTFSGTARQSSKGGYFDENAKAIVGVSAISQTEFITPVTGDGVYFIVPTGQGIKYVGLNLRKDTTTQDIDGTYQLEKGEMATPIVPHTPEYKIQEQYLPENHTDPQSVSQIDLLPRPFYGFEKNKISNFINHHILKDKDIVIAGTGTSLTARSSEHCTVRSDATSRPPLLHSNNFASKIWDRIVWDGQEYRRFDYPSFFTETGTWTSNANLSDWDDATYRYGITRYANGNASISFVVPINAWQFNFIYRSDSAGTQSATVTISEGNNKMEVWNGSSWVEANGYTFSMRETPVILSNISVYNPQSIDNSTVLQETYQVGGNTTYQKRLKMRCKSSSIDSRSTTKTVTISSTSDRLLYWGVEWSPREFMITYINAARGSHSLTYSSNLSLSHFQDNEIWSFKPDLIFTENPIHNSGGGGGQSYAQYYTSYWGYATFDFFFNENNPISLISRAAANNITNLEWIVFTSSLAWNFNGINDDGTLKLYTDKNGKVITSLDAQTFCNQWIENNKSNVVAINACKYWCDAGRKIFGDLKTATMGSGKDGNTFTNEGSHWNNTGCTIMDRCIGGIFDLYN